MDKLLETTRIYYHGDMANDPCKGTITKAYTDRWGSFYDIKLDDGRDIKHLHTIAFSPEFKGHCGTKFVTLEAYNAYRDKITHQFINKTKEATK